MTAETTTAQNATTEAPVAPVLIVEDAPKSRWGWKRISVYAGVAVVATAATYVGVKIMRKPKAVAAVVDAASAVADAVAPSA